MGIYADVDVAATGLVERGLAENTLVLLGSPFLRAELAEQWGAYGGGVTHIYGTLGQHIELITTSEIDRSTFYLMPKTEYLRLLREAVQSQIETHELGEE